MTTLHLRAEMADLMHDQLLLHADEQQREQRSEEDASHDERQTKPRHPGAQPAERMKARRGSQLVRPLGEAIGKFRRELECFVLLELVLDDERREEAAIHPPRDVVPRGNR